MVACPGCGFMITAGAVCARCGFVLRTPVPAPVHTNGTLLAAIAGTFFVSMLGTCLAVRPSESGRERLEDYDRVRTIAVRHEACLRELSYTDTSPSDLDDAKDTLRRVRSKADDCYRGHW